MTEQEIIDALLEHYERKGLSLNTVINDPIFEKLPVAERVKAIQQHANRMAQGTTPNSLFSKAKTIGAGTLGGMLAGGLAGITAHSLLPEDTPIGTTEAAIVGSILLGTVGGARSIADVMDTSTARNSIKQDLARTAEDPSLTNAIGVLSDQSRSPGLELKRKITRSGVFDAVHSHFAGHTLNTALKTQHKAYTGT